NFPITMLLLVDMVIKFICIIRRYIKTYPECKGIFLVEGNFNACERPITPWMYLTGYMILVSGKALKRNIYVIERITFRGGTRQRHQARNWKVNRSLMVVKCLSNILLMMRVMIAIR